MTTSQSNNIEQKAKVFYAKHEPLFTKANQHLFDVLTKLCHQYCEDHNLPHKAITVQSRKKSLSSLINKLKRRGQNDIRLNDINVTDVVGARIICWFLDDCYGILETFLQDNQLLIVNDSIENFIDHPKDTGYRSIHVLTGIDTKNWHSIEDVKELLAEIQIRTKLQDSWAEITHEFHYKAKYLEVNHPTYESLLADISDRLSLEDHTFMKFRDAYGELANGQPKK